MNYAYLCGTSSAHQRDEACGRWYLFSKGVYKVLSLVLKLSHFKNSRDDSADTPRGLLYINISVGDVLYIND